MVGLGLLRFFYILFFLCIAILLMSLVALVMPSDLGYSGEYKGFINSVKNWIEMKHVSLILDFLKESDLYVYVYSIQSYIFCNHSGDY